MTAQARRALADRFRAALTAAQQERHLRPDLVTVNGQPECEWAAYERSVMHTEVNHALAMRAARIACEGHTKEN